jgi:hypothetical protein
MSKLPYEQVAAAVEQLYAINPDPSQFASYSEAVEQVIRDSGWEVDQFLPRFFGDPESDLSLN